MRPRSDRRPTWRNRRFLALTGLTVAFAVTACERAVPESGDVESGSAQGNAIEVVALDDEFDPSTLELEPGTEVVLEVRNDGERPHNLVIDEIDLSTGTLESGDVVTVKFIVPNTAVTFFCSFHRGMDGRLQPVSG